MITHETQRLKLRELEGTDAPFILELLNDPGFLRYIGDRKVRTLEQARAYIANGPQLSYREYGFGLLLMQAKSDGTAVGMCGLVQRSYLPDADLGFALLPDFRAKGLCVEAGRAVLEYARTELMFRRISAIVQPGNEASLGVLKKLGFELDRRFKLSAEAEELLVLAKFLHS